MTANNPSLSGAAHIHIAGSATCSAEATRGLTVTLFHYYALLPNPTVNTAASTGSGLSLSATHDVCDNGGSTTYYTSANLVWLNMTSTVVNTGDGTRVTLSHC